jgi:hypothetical protein
MRGRQWLFGRSYVLENGLVGQEDYLAVGCGIWSLKRLSWSRLCVLRFHASLDISQVTIFGWILPFLLIVALVLSRCLPVRSPGSHFLQR